MTSPLGEFRRTHTPPSHYRKLPMLQGVLLSIPLWGLVIAAVFNVVVRMVLLALAVVLLAGMLPARLALLSNSLLLVALGLVVLGIVLALARWF